MYFIVTLCTFCLLCLGTGDGDCNVFADLDFLKAARAGNLDKVLQFLKMDVDIHSCSSSGLNALHFASKAYPNVVEALLQRKADVDSTTKRGNTALHIASLAGQDEIVKILVENGANVNIQSKRGFTPLYMAAQKNHNSVVRFLLAHGANQSLAVEGRYTPLDVARQQGHDRVVSILLENEARDKVLIPGGHTAEKKDDAKSATPLRQTDHNPNITSEREINPLHIAECPNISHEDVEMVLQVAAKLKKFLEKILPSDHGDLNNVLLDSSEVFEEEITEENASENSLLRKTEAKIQEVKEELTAAIFELATFNNEKSWKKTFMESSVYDGEAARRRTKTISTSLVQCILRANSILWSHLVCYNGKECLITDTKIRAESNASLFEDPVQCFAHQTSLALIDNNFLVSPALSYQEAKDYCKENGASPFVPYTREEYQFLIRRGSVFYLWYPLNDILNEGEAVYEDGTVLSDRPLKWIDVFTYPNNDKNDCVSLYSFTYTTKVSWSDCKLNHNSMVCIKDKLI